MPRSAIVTPLSETARGVLLATVGVSVLSPDALLVRLLAIDHWSIIFWRGILLAVTLLGFIIVRHRRRAPAQLRAVGRAGLLAGCLFAGSTVSFVTSISLTAAANTLVIISAEPLFAALLSFVFLREAIALRTWIAVLTVLVGIAVIFSGSLGGGALVGDLCAVGTALFMAGNFVVVRHARAINMVPSVALSGLIAALLVSPLAAPLSPGPRDVALLLALGVFVLPVSFGLIQLAPRHLPAPEVSLILLLESILGSLWVWMALDEVPAPETFIGGALLLVTVGVHSLLGLRRTRRREPPAPPADLHV